MGALGPPPLTLSEGPELVGIDPGAIAGAAARYKAAAGRVASLGSSFRSARDDLSGSAWLGLAAIAFELSAGQVNGTYRAAEQVLTGVSSTLGTLASELAAASAQAQSAQRLASQVNTDTQTLNTTYETRVRTQTATLAGTLHHMMTVEDAAAVATPTPSEAAQSNALIGTAGRATTLMEDATRAARTAWQRAATAFDFATAQAPAVQAAVAAARKRAAAAAEAAHQGSFWGGLANLGGFVALGIVDVGADALTDGAATPLDEGDAGEMANLGEGALADFAGGGATAGELASAEEAASAEVSVDGAPIGDQVAGDAAAAQSGPGTWTTANESMSPSASGYQEQVTGAPPGSVYETNGVRFDGYSGGVLQDAKGPGYASFVQDGQFVSWFKGQYSLLDQAERQLVAAEGTPITWSVAEPQAAEAIRALFAENGISGIKVLYVPPAG